MPLASPFCTHVHPVMSLRIRAHKDEQGDRGPERDTQLLCDLFAKR
jgi:hypothetical protein